MRFFFAGIGGWRFLSDVLFDAYPQWIQSVSHSWLYYTVRGPSDGSFWGDLNTQYFKILSIPCGISCLFVLRWFFSEDLGVTQREWQSTEFRGIVLGSLALMVTICEIEKATHVLGLKMAGLLRGEKGEWNHFLHLVSALLGWYYMNWLKFVPPREVPPKRASRITTRAKRSPQDLQKS